MQLCHEADVGTDPGETRILLLLWLVLQWVHPWLQEHQGSAGIQAGAGGRRLLLSADQPVYASLKFPLNHAELGMSKLEMWQKKKKNKKKQ